MKEVFFYIGALGFFSVFQAIGTGIVFSVYKSIVDTKKKKKLSADDIAGGVFGCLFGIFFALLPLEMAHEFGGIPLLAVQLMVLTTIISFVVIPCHPLKQCKSVAQADMPPLVDVLPVRELAPDLWRALPGSLCCFFLAGAYAAAIINKPLPGMEKDWLAALVMIEFLVIHSLPFLSLITLPRFDSQRWRVFQWFLFGTWYCLYLGFAMETRDNWDALIAFVLATIGTYLGFILQESNENRVILVFKRWIVTLSLFVGVAVIVNGRDIKDIGSAMRLGLIYFILIGIVELTPIYRMNWRDWLDAQLLKWKK